MKPLDQIEISIEEAKEVIALRDALVRIMANKDFNTVIKEGYFTTEAARLVMCKGEPNLDDNVQREIDILIKGISGTSHYFRKIMRDGAEMDVALGESEQTREELLAEELS